ncbi:MAG: hypothetical protein RL329_2697 [Bacteroidota bacterium]|jgi:predicted ABC-type ATPase
MAQGKRLLRIISKQRVAFRVLEGGHNIPEQVLERWYHRGLNNLFELYMPICDNVMLFGNSNKKPIFAMEVEKDKITTIYHEKLFIKIKNSYHE